MTPSRFVDLVSGITLPNVFNPWAEVCPVADRPDAADIRRANLRQALVSALQLQVESIVIGRDLGYRGGRRTGLALTDEVHLPAFSKMYGRLRLNRATKGPVVAERTAAMFWEVIERLGTPVFTWNVFPFHPHEPSEPLTNRCHTTAERQICEPVLAGLIELLRPVRVIAVGNDAEVGLKDLGIKCSKVRHPSYGGKADFVAGMLALHPGSSSGLPAYEAQARLF